MKVSELIEQLKQFDGDCEVLLSDGYLLDGSPIASIVVSICACADARKEIILTYVRKDPPAQPWEYQPPIIVPAPYTPAPPYDPSRVLCTNETTATNKTYKDDSK